MKKERVIIIGASSNPERYAYKAQRALLEAGHEVVLVNRGYDEIDGLPVIKDLGEVTGPVDVITLYVNPKVSTLLIDKILALRPGRVIFNPGTTNSLLQLRLDEMNIPWRRDCTLWLLRNNRFQDPIPMSFDEATTPAPAADS